jgi:uroporphyrinogen decarboxylase
MNARDRVLTTIDHREPDRVPVGEWGVDHDHVEKILGHPTYVRNRKEMTIAFWEGRRDEVVESYAADLAALVEKLDHDIVTVPLVPPKGHRFDDPPRQVAEGVWEDRAGRVYKYAASNDSIMCLTPPAAKDHLTDGDLEAYRESLMKVDDSQFQLVDEMTKRFGKDRIVLFRDLSFYETVMNPFGGDQTHQLMLTLMAADEIRKVHDIAVDYNNLLIDRCAEKGVKIVMQGYDYGTNNGCIMDPQSIRDLYFPPMKRSYDHAASLGLIPFFHCCGRIWDILDDYIASGHRGYQSIQSSAGMGLAEVKKQYGNRLTLWAGIQCETLIGGTRRDVINEVRQSLDICMPGGGYIFGSTNTVQFGAKTDNYLAALDTLRTYGTYGA